MVSSLCALSYYNGMHEFPEAFILDKSSKALVTMVKSLVTISTSEEVKLSLLSNIQRAMRFYQSMELYQAVELNLDDQVHLTL